MILHPRLLLTTAAGLACAATALAIEDTAPIDAKPILEALRTIKNTQETTIKTTKARFIQEAQAAAANPAKAAEYWEEAVRATQFQGVPKENAQFKDWREKDGEALRDPEVKVALHLYFNWLALTLQRSAGAEVKTLFPQVLQHAREVANDQTTMEAFEEAAKLAKDVPVVPSSVKRPVTAAQKEKKQDNQTVKRVHDQILKNSLASSAFVQWMRLSDYITDVAPQKGRGGGGKGKTAAAQAALPDDAPAPSWEGTPGNFDGIYQNILLPEMRNVKDLRLLEYWDNKIKREGEAATRSQKTFEIEKFNQVRRPSLIWSRDQDLIRVGQKNRGIADMFAQIKAFPTHPEAAGWIAELEGLLTPTPTVSAAPAPDTTATLDPAPAPAPAAPAAPVAPATK
ncbi:MAG TPA: hypothetical protein VGO11_21780 [Chthoniobacteraceae bacterium]|jgi:hypothetical protein|nr:hypothetical protein [Chthoniobacteraceae bacterium]